MVGANNYLGLSNHPALVSAAHKALDTHGFGLSSVRFICGTQVSLHACGSHPISVHLLIAGTCPVTVVHVVQRDLCIRTVQ